MPRLAPIWTATVVGALLVCFAALSFTAVLGKSATYDEPLHLVGGMVHRYASDYRINPEDPALFGWWATLPHARAALPLNTADAFFEGATGSQDQQWWFVVDTLYARPADAADRLLNQSRAMFVILGIALGALIALWAYQIAGSWAAIAASILFCFDPNFLGHSALVKNDVPLSLMMCLLGFFIWKFGRNGRQGGKWNAGWLWLLLALLTCGLAFCIKFSAVLFGPLLVVLLTIRAFMPAPWKLSGFPLRTIWQRFALVLASGVAALVFIYVITWSVYGFRYSATATGQPMLTTSLVNKSVKNKVLVGLTQAQLAKLTTNDLTKLVDAKVSAGEIPIPVKVDLWMEAHHLLPEGWLLGFLYTYATTLMRSAFLLGAVGIKGWWYYFPLAMLFKTPAATIFAAITIPLVCAASRWIPGGDIEEQTENAEASSIAVRYWTPVVLTLPPAIYFLTALSANLNLGLRHVLPVYPFIFIGLAVGIASLLKRWPVPAAFCACVLAMGLIAETACAYPNYVAFFNVVSNVSGGGIRLLGDSNLDWGQDLRALAEWQRAHPTDRLYLSYFGIADPRAYGIDFVNLPGGWPFGPSGNLDANVPGVVAISATNLQGIYIGRQMADEYTAALQGEKPFRIINGTIYLYAWPPTN